jgi:ribosomal protein S18 acetylase RimI-like enzyme
MIEYRKILKKDIPKIATLYINLALYIKQETKDPYFEINDLSEQSTICSLEKDIQDKTKQIFVAVENDNIVGFIAGVIIDCFLPFSKVTKVGYISGAYVSEENRNNGIMKNLEKMITSYFMEHKLTYAELNVMSNNFVGKKTWNKLGYVTFREQMRKKLT